MEKARVKRAQATENLKRARRIEGDGRAMVVAGEEAFVKGKREALARRTEGRFN